MQTTAQFQQSIAPLGIGRKKSAAPSHTRNIRYLRRKLRTFLQVPLSFDGLGRSPAHGGGLADEIEFYPYRRSFGRICRGLEQGEALTGKMEFSIRRMGSMLEPALIMLVGLLVAVILIFMYMPMFSLDGIMG